MKKYYIYILISILLGFFLTINFINDDNSSERKNSKKIVSLSTFVLYDIAKHISEDTFELIRIIPSGVDIHAFEPTPKMMAKVESSDLLIYSGAGLEPWLQKFSFKNKQLAISNYVNLIHAKNSKDNQHHEHHGESCSHGAYDPHFWLDVENMKKAAVVISENMSNLEPKYKKLYAKNLKAYVEKLEGIDKKYVSKLKSCKLNSIITNHNAFSYLSARYSFTVNALKGLSPDSEPSPKDMIRILKEIEKKQIPVLFFEDFSSSKSMTALATEANIKIDSLHTLGNITKDDMDNNRSYEDIMLDNLTKIHEALICQ